VFAQNEGYRCTCPGCTKADESPRLRRLLRR